MRHLHLTKQLDVFTHLSVIFLMLASELEVDDMCLFAIGDDTVGTAFHHLSVFVQTQDATLVKQLPTFREPLLYTVIRQSLPDDVHQFLAGYLVIVENSFLLHL